MKQIAKNIGVTLIALLGATVLWAQTIPVAGTVYNEEKFSDHAPLTIDYEV